MEVWRQRGRKWGGVHAHVCINPRFPVWTPVGSCSRGVRIGTTNAHHNERAYGGVKWSLQWVKASRMVIKQPRSGDTQGHGARFSVLENACRLLGMGRR